MSQSWLRRLSVAAAAAVLALPVYAGSAAAQDASKVVAYRQGVMKALGWHIGPIAAMAKGEMEFDSAKLQHDANALAALSLIIAEGFPEGSMTDSSKAKAEIWSDMADFQAKAAALQEAAAVLAARAPYLTQATLGEQLGAVGKACGACHDKFRSK